jgi:hypothetical protein
MIIGLMINFLFLSVACVACDQFVTKLIAGGRLAISRTDAAVGVCLTIPVVAYLARGMAGLVDVSPLAVVGPTYVYLTKTTACAINLKQLLSQTWEGIKHSWKQITGVK